ncbi:MAG: hypothetical protein AAB214_10445 [Fibrobacterota bacterium]
MSALLPSALLHLLFACSPDWTVGISEGRTGRSVIELSTGGETRRTPMPWPVWSIQRGDADGDGCPDLLLGVFKRNRFDSTARRRLQFWKVDRGRLRPGWLGTRLSGDLDTFALETPGRILARERIGPAWQIARWKWTGFGFRMDSLLVRDPNRPRFPRSPHRGQ